MAIYGVDFIFCCPCYVDNIFDIRYLPYKQRYEFVHFIRRRHLRHLFDVDDFKEKKTMLISCFLHFADSMYLDSLECLHYNRGVYYQIRLDNNSLFDKKSVAYVIEEV